MNETPLTRREMCRLVAAGSVTISLGADLFAAAALDAFALRYILASSMYGKTKLAEILPDVRKSGAWHVDVWPMGHADQREQVEAMGHDKFAELLRRNNVELGMITQYRLGPFGLQDEMRVLRKLGGTMLISGSRGPNGLSGPECKPAVKKFVEQMKPHVAAAEELGVTIGIENHAGALICSPDSMRYLGEFATSPNLGIALAPYHLPQDPQLLGKLIEDLGPNLVHYYAWQHGQGCHKKLPKAQELEQMPGRGKLDFTSQLAALKKIGYSGWTEIFMHPVPRGIPILDTTDQVTEEINRARRYLEDCLRRVNR